MNTAHQSGQRKPKKRKRCSPGEALVKDSPVTENITSDAIEEKVRTIIESLETDNGTLSDRLNPDHPRFDKLLKESWKRLPKKSRARIVEADLSNLNQTRCEGMKTLESLPYSTEPDDHCESPPEAYQDIAAVLDLIASAIGKTRATLRIYDPYFCAGSMKKHLRSLGFTSVYNEPVDFYDTIKRKMLPPHDVVVTNPPYSGDHVQRLIDFCLSHDRPYLCLMPNYVCVKQYYVNAFSSPTVAGEVKAIKQPYFLCPRKRYQYWTPKSMRPKEKVQSHSSTLGHRTSPFISFWYVMLEPTCRQSEIGVLSPAPACSSSPCGRPPPLFCRSVAELPSAVRPSHKHSS